jgi:hypothetical protein
MKKITILAVANIILVIIVCALIAQEYGLLTNHQGEAEIFTDGATVKFSAWENQTWLGIKDRLAVVNTDSNFTGNRTLEWFSIRNSSSGDYYQKSMEYLCFWSGQGFKGEWEAVISIYNSPNSKTDFVVEVSRFTWHSLQVTLDKNVIVSFPQVTKDTSSIGYATFHVISN